MQGTILLVDDERDVVGYFSRILEREGFVVCSAADAAGAREQAAAVYPDVMVIDIGLPDADGVELMSEMRGEYPHAQYIVMTGHGTIRSAVESTRLGAFEYLTKPVQGGELIVALNNAMKARQMTEVFDRLQGVRPGDLGRYPSPVMRRVVDEALRAAASNVTVLLNGESGTGKNYLARWIHDHSDRAGGPFFDINCASLSPSLVESELFGHEPGAFTGSRGRKRGLLELAGDGTLLLDEIGDMDLALQAKLLSFLDTQYIRRLGGESAIKVNSRIIAATNHDLEQAVRDKRFRQDLYYRLNVLAIVMPPLRERRQDIPLLAEELLGRLAHEMNLVHVPVPAPEVMEELQAYDWPGNVREFRNVLERSLLERRNGDMIRQVHFAPRGVKMEKSRQPAVFTVHFPEEGLPLKDTVDDMIRELILEALRRGQTKKKAAALLGITRHSLAHYLKSLNLDA